METGSKLLDIGCGDNVFEFVTKSKGNRNKNKQVGPQKTKKILHSEGNHQHNGKAAHWMGEDICKSYI